MAASCAIVIPCFEEEKRLAEERFIAFASDERMDLIFVDDGSRDRTIDVLERVRDRSPKGKVEVVQLPKNGGKGEAVRQGMRGAITRGYTITGYADADLSTPPDELARMLDVLLLRADLEIAVASRVLMVGRRIEREARRHYLGRVFATAASRILEAPFYDTQCGAKLFRVTQAFETTLDEPFVSRWAFDVEILGRLLTNGVPLDRFLEIPLDEWIDKPGSKLHFKDMARSVVDLVKIDFDLRARRSKR